MHDEIPVFAELAAIRVSNEKVEPWQDDLYMPAIARPQSRQPPQPPSRYLDHHVAWHGASEELARKTLLGSADMRLWVVQQDPVVVAAPETPVSPSSPSKLLYNLSSALDKADCSAISEGEADTMKADVVISIAKRKQRVKAFLCHKHILSRASLTLRYRIKTAKAALQAKGLRPLPQFEPREEAAEGRQKERAQKVARPPRKFQPQKLRVSRPSILEFKLSIREDPSAFADILALLYGMPLKVTHGEMKRWCTKRWWPALALSKELQLPDIEAGLRKMILDLPNQVPLDMTWALLSLAHAHNLKEETHHCSEVLARHSAKCRLATLPVLHALHVDALTHLLCSDAWIVSMEAELFSPLQTWLKGQPWVNWAKRDRDKEKVVAPPEVFAASAKWGIRWGHVHAKLMEKLMSNSIVPETLASDIDRWRSSAGGVLPPLPLEFSQDDRRSSQKEAEKSLLDSPRRGSSRKERKKTRNIEDLKQGPSSDDQTSGAERAVSSAIRLILSAKVAHGSSVPISPETTEWRTQSVQLDAQSAKDAFLQGTRSLCDAIDGRFGIQYNTSTMITAMRRDGENQKDEGSMEVSEELRAAKKLAGKLVAYIPPTCSWMSRRRCFHAELALPNHPWEFFSKAIFNGRTTLQCRGEPPKLDPDLGNNMRTGRRRSSGLFFEGNRLFELQKAPSSSSSSSEAEAEDPEATAEASPKATAEGEATDAAEAAEAAEASQVPDAQAEEVRSKASSPSEDMNAQEMEALFSNNGRLARLTAIRQISAGRHEFLFRVLVRRPLPSSSRVASTPILTKAVSRKFADAFQISTGIFTNPAQSMLGDEDQGVTFKTKNEKMLGTLTEVARFRPDQMESALGECDLPLEWPPGGFFDCFLIVVLEPHLKEMRVAVDATFTKPYGVFAEDECDEGEANDEDESGKDSQQVAGELEKIEKESKPTLPVAAAHFVQHRPFLRRWRLEDCLQQDLKHGIVLQNSMRGAGYNPLFLPTFDLDVEALCTLGGPGGSATVEVLPAGALRPSWWIALMGNTVDLPRPHADSDDVIPAMTLPL